MMKQDPNINKQGYKKTKLGWIPENWKVINLGEIGSTLIGLTYSPEDIVEYNGKLVLRSSNIRNSIVVYDDCVYVSTKIPDKLFVKTDDILICVRNGSRKLIGKCVLITKKHENHAFGAFMSVYRSKYNKIIFQYFQTDLYNKQIYQNLGATINQITTRNLNSFRFPLPPLSEQKKIATILSAWDKTIELTEKLIETMRKRKKALMQQLLIGKKRFKEFVKDEWKISKLSDFLTIVSYPVPKPGNPYTGLGLRSHGKGTFFKSIDKPEAVMMDTLYQVKEDNLIVNITFAWEGAIAIISKNDEVGLVSHRFPTYEFNKSIVISDYFRQVIIGKYFVFLLGLISPGGAGRNRVMSKKDFLKLQLKIPSLNEQQKIAKMLTKADQEITILRNKLESLKKQKKGLMQKLLTGQVRVKL